jgi:hypothetical protein
MLNPFDMDVNQSRISLSLTQEYAGFATCVCFWAVLGCERESHLEVRMSRPYLIDTIFPANEIHLLVGASGAGKTTWLFQMIDDWLQGKPVLGFQSHPCPWQYIALERSIETTLETIRRTKANIDLNHVHSLRDSNLPINEYDPLFNYFVNTYLKDGGLLIIDGFTALTPQGKYNDHKIVADYLVTLGRWIKKKNLTVLGIMPIAKSKGDERAKIPRQRVYGNVVWEHYSETIFLLESVKEDDPENPLRKLTVLPRNSAEFCLDLVFDDAGRLVEQAAEVSALVLETKLAKLDPGTETDRATWIKWGAEGGISRASVDRWLAKSLHNGKLTKSGRSSYKVNFAQ